MKKILAAILCIVMLVSFLASCSEKTDDPLVTNPPEEDFNPFGFDFDQAFSAFEPDAVMFTAGGFDVTWGELFIFLRGNIGYMLSSFGTIDDWSEILYDDTTFADSIIESSVDYALIFKSVEYGASLLNITLNEEDHAFLQQDYEMMAAQFGGEEMFLQILWDEDGFYSKEIFQYIISIDALVEKLFTALYGEDGSVLTDDEVSELMEDEGFLMAKHILRLREEGSEEVALAEIEDILSQLEQFLEEHDEELAENDFDAFFHSLMLSYSEDEGGLESYPEGYLFQDGDMDLAFFEATVALGIGQFSGIVESDYGYHIIYRLPIDYDEVPFAFYLYGDTRSLRHLAALHKFDIVMNEWKENLVIEFSSNFDALDIAVLFPV